MYKGPGSRSSSLSRRGSEDGRLRSRSIGKSVACVGGGAGGERINYSGAVSRNVDEEEIR
jgi:hypothetical protein